MTQSQLIPAKKTKINDQTNFRPLGNRVLLRRLDAEQTLKGGIILPESSKKKQEQAEIIALGSGKKDKDGHIIPIDLKIGDIVLMEKYSGQEIHLNDEDLVIVRADDLIAVIEK